MYSATGLVFDERCFDHEIEPGHPESQDRLRAVSRLLEASGLRSQLRPIAAAADSYAALGAVHSPSHIAAVRGLPGAGAAAALSASGVLSAVDAVCRGEVKNAFCAVRPPGHHAHDLGREEGFCYYNNVAVAARHAQKAHGCSRILIVDWDYHHGNGTEDAFYDDPSVFFFSTHRWRAYPGTGDPGRLGEGAGRGYNLNVDLPAGAGDRDVLDAWERRFLPLAESFSPDLVLISAGFDSREDDWLGDFRFTDDVFARMTRMALQLAAGSARGRVVSCLEGGYNPEGLARGVLAHLGEMASV